MSEIEEQDGHGEFSIGPGAANAQYEQAKTAALDVLREHQRSFVIFFEIDDGLRALGSFTGSVLMNEDTEPVDAAGVLSTEFLRSVATAAAEAYDRELKKYMKRGDDAD